MTRMYEHHRAPPDSRSEPGRLPELARLVTDTAAESTARHLR
ncbi:hypothetical protein ABZZ80_19740 [Streptomyces sp. NPDC006356]